ncbi:CPBP family intramembrane metalloprotease [Flavobacterium album]|uniref:CPBP family intramembrane metalloprotease n=1 Tax=Flavobacterium album TaxID=2175091 RepID=A0A2S1R349_9FLAO|nr:CPBP family intramembrane metalloprotease [Flavobacterium album]
MKQFKQTNWLKILAFYGIILTGTYFARKLPNVFSLVMSEITDVSFPFNYNHGLVTLAVALLFYAFDRQKQEITLLGDNKVKSLLFPAVLFICYSVYGINNSQGIDNHLWAAMFCGFALVYNIMEEYAWRGYLIESQSKMNYVFKSLLSGVLWAIWHLLIFENFNQYGGFWIFLVFCIIFSFLLTFAVIRTNSILAAAAIHAFIIQTNIVALICFVIFILLLVTWNKKIPKERKSDF